MKKVGIILACLIVAVVAVAVAWNVAYPSGTWRYKMTVEVETPEGIKTGEVVRGIEVSMHPRIFEDSSSVRVLGESLFIDLGKRGILFAFLDWDYAKGVVLKAFPFKGAYTPEGIRYYESLLGRTKELDKNHYPKFIYFKDINDPKTAEYVIYRKRFCTIHDRKKYDCKVGETFDLDNLQEVFGEGVRVKSIRIEMTDAEITRYIESKLPWLSTFNGAYLSGKRARMSQRITADELQPLYLRGY